MLPWLQDHVAETREAFGGDDRWWKDGLKANRHVVDQFLEYSFKQGLAKKRWQPEEIFAPSSLEAFVV
jgi:4,5-dihydroxyphthalate decarboxylase